MKRIHLIKFALIAAAGWLITYSPVHLNKGQHSFDEDTTYNHPLNSHDANDQHVLIDIADFENFVADGEIPQGHQETFELDSTGDGEMERIVKSISWNEGECIISCSIKRDEQSIWEDSFVISRDDARSFYVGIDDERLPHLQYYLGLCQLNFMDKFQENKDELIAQLARKMLEGPFSEADRNQVVSYLRDYQGYYLGTLNLFDESLYSWNDTKQTFTLLTNS